VHEFSALALRLKGTKVESEINSIGLIELSSVAAGILVEDTMLKAAAVRLLLARTICSGKFLIVVAGDVTSVQSALHAGAASAGPSLIERRQIARVHSSVLAAVSQAVEVNADQLRSIGIIETFSAASAIEAADTAVNLPTSSSFAYTSPWRWAAKDLSCWPEISQVFRQRLRQPQKLLPRRECWWAAP